MEVVWKDVVGFEGLYIVSNIGIVQSINPCHGNHYTTPIMTPQKSCKGYLRVKLKKDGKIYMSSIHRLVAMAFIPNPNNYEFVNHKDENKENNNVENLEWCTPRYNANYYLDYKHGRRHKPRTRFEKINQYSIDGKLIKTHENINLASHEFGCTRSEIYRVCENNKSRKSRNNTTNNKFTCCGYVWEYA